MNIQQQEVSHHEVSEAKPLSFESHLSYLNNGGSYVRSGGAYCKGGHELDEQPCKECLINLIIKSI